MIDHNSSFSDDGNPNGDDIIIRLKSSGMLLNRNIEASEYGLITSYTNYTMRNKSCPITSVNFNNSRYKTNDNIFMITDNRGQVYNMNITNNKYTSIRLASSAISAITFVNSHKNHVVIGYENGQVLVVDTMFKTIVGNIQLTKLLSNQQGNISPARIVKCHPSLPLVLIATDDRNLSMWSLETFECNQSLDSFEPLVDVRFEFDGSAIAVTKKYSGVFLYDTITAELALHLQLPKGERRVGWTCYSSHKCKGDKGKGVHILLGAENSMIYSWYASKSQSTCHLLGIVELPLKMQMAVNIVLLSISSAPPRVLVMSNSGDVSIFQIDGFSDKSIGIWTIVADIPADLSFSLDESLRFSPAVYRPTAVGDLRSNPSLESSLGRIDAKDNYFVCIGLDGIARLFDAELSTDFGQLCGKKLNSRPPTLDSSKKSDPSDFYLDSSRRQSTSFRAVTYPTSHKRMDRSKVNKTVSGVVTARVSKSKRLDMNKHSSSGSLIISRSKDSSVNRNNADLALYELAALTNKEQQLNIRKLRAFLSVQGEYPTRYRPLIWRFLLKLPENAQAFTDLSHRGIHESYENLYDKYPIQSRKIFSRLQELCSRVAHWAPILGDATYLPSLVFPIMLVFASDDLAAYETCITIMMWWGHSWHITHPNPPVHILDAIDSLLKFHDPKLYSHFIKLNTSIGSIGWTMISSFFSEILGRNDWLKLVDYLFTNFENISIMLCTPIAILKELKVSLLSTSSAAQLVQYCRNQQGINMDTCIGNINHMLTNTPTRYFTAVTTKYIDPQTYDLGVMSSNGLRELNDTEVARENMSLGNGRPMFPLTKGRYPMYDGYPKHIVDLQLLERSKVLAMGKEISRKENVLKALQEKLSEVEQDHEKWMAGHKGASEADMKYQREVMLKERLHLEELQRIEEEISLQRINLLKSLEVIAKEQMDAMDRSSADCAKFIKEGDEHMKLKQSVQFNMLKHKELAEVAEVKTLEQISRLRMNRVKEDLYSGVSGLVNIKEDEFAMKDAILHEKWLKEDDELRIRRQSQERDLQLLQEQNNFSLLEEEANANIARLHLMRDAKILEIERTRAARIAKEHSMDAIESADRAALLLRKQKIKSNEEQLAKLTEAGFGQVDDKLSETIRNIRSESEKILDTERILLMREAKVRQQAAQVQLRKEWSEKSSEQLGSILKSERELQERLQELRKKSISLEIEKNLSVIDLGDFKIDNEVVQESHHSQKYQTSSSHRNNTTGMNQQSNKSSSPSDSSDNSSIKWSKVEEKRTDTEQEDSRIIDESNRNFKVENPRITQLEMLSSDDDDYENELPYRDALKRANKVLLQEDNSSSTSGTNDELVQNSKQMDYDQSIHFSKIYGLDDNSIKFVPTVDLINNNNYGQRDQEAYTQQMRRNYFINEKLLSDQVNQRSKETRTTTRGTTVSEVNESHTFLPNVELTVDSDSALWAYEDTND